MSKRLEIEDFLRYRYISALKASPAGSRLAFVIAAADEEKNRYRSSLWLYENGETRQLADLQGRTAYYWEDEGHILYPAKPDKQEGAEEKKSIRTLFRRLDVFSGTSEEAFTLPLAAEKLERFCRQWLITAKVNIRRTEDWMGTEEEREARAAEREKEEKDFQVIEELPFYANGGGFVDGDRSALFLFEEESGRLTRLTGNGLSVYGTLVMEDKLFFTAGKREGVSPYDDGQLYTWERESGKVQALSDEHHSISWIAELNGHVLCAAKPKGDPYATAPDESFYLYDEEKGGLVLFAKNDDALENDTNSDCRFGPGNFFFTAPEGLYLTKTIGAACGLYLLNAAGEMTPVLVRPGAIDGFARLADGSLVVNAMLDGRLQELYRLDIPGEGRNAKEESRACPENSSLTQITHINEEVLSDAYVADYQPLTVRSCGWDIRGWVLLPKDFDPAKRYPAILDIHGGPRTVYGEVFVHEMQAWANRGYFVFFCNPVGSSGGGRDFADITGKYGKDDYQNIMDFTDAVLAAYPQIDPARLGCTGGSYGGFMSNWILGHTDRFAAIATQRSISNWISFYGVSDIGFRFGKSEMGADMHTAEGIKRMWDLSPLAYAESMRTPTLIIHSFEDYRCPIEQAYQLFTALKERGVPVRMCAFHGENHELSRSGKPLSRLRRLREITGWMDKYLQQTELTEEE